MGAACARLCSDPEPSVPDPLSIRIDINPNLAELGPLLLTWHGVFTAAGIIGAILIAAFFARRRGILEDDI